MTGTITFLKLGSIPKEIGQPADQRPVGKAESRTMNAITKHNSTGITPVEKNYFEQYSEAANQNRVLGDLLKFNKGDWLCGQNDEPIKTGTLVVAAMSEMQIGWTRWAGGKPAENVMGRVADGFQPPRRSELGDMDQALWEIDDRNVPRDPWQFQNVLYLQNTDDDRIFTFVAGSKGSIGAVGKLSGVYGKRIRHQPNEFPMVALNVDAYLHPNKSFGRVKIPVLDVMGWVDKANVLAAIAGENLEAEPAPEAKPAHPMNDDIPF